MIKPLNRDQQIELMERTKERSASRIARWKQDEVIKSVLTVPPPQEQDHTVSYSRHDLLVACA
ncbi:hypothetical protein EDE05_11449 [Neorhizobium sp. R1-B]|uniref:hypothetical protein n=1 Tax=Neorhizobium sp. R1-B TaxID=2485162 RepID=UPI001066606D|nr:hypothetical protein [Neorhizobium sp. R1-B]TDX77740.1 hypothetical protein EDE05_11449 [Neorhizobium sp. R1-B]